MQLTILLLWSSLPVTLLVARELWTWRRSASVRLLYALVVGTTGWCLAYSFEILASSESAKLLWATAQYPFIGMLPVAWMGLALSLWRHGRAPSRRLLIALSVVPLLTQPLVWTNELHRLVWRGHSLESLGGLTLLRVEHGPAFWVFNVYCLAVIGAGLLLLCALAFTNRSMRVSQRVALLLAAALPAVGNLLYTLRIGPVPGLDLTPLAFTLSAVAAGHATRGAGFLNIVLMARDMVLERLPESVFVLDRNRLVVDANASARALADGKGGFPMGLPLETLWPELPADWDVRLREGSGFHVASVSGAEQRDLSVKAIPLARGDGAEAGLVVIATDITAEERSRRELEQARIAAEAGSRAKSRFLATISHEIRTPMNGILGMAQLIAAETDDPGTRGRAAAIIESGQNLLTVLSDVIDMAQAESGMLELHPTLFDVRQLLEGLQIRYAGAAQAAGLTFSCEIDPGLPVSLVGDARRIDQILSNLLGNAIKFTRTGRIAMRVLWEQPANAGPMLVCTVNDTGIGMTREELGRIFTLFEQADGSHARRASGLGLGLAIVRHLTGMMGGEISVESVQGLGSAFTLRLPLPTA
jgi:signal transduction histidine kinase